MARVSWNICAQQVRANKATLFVVLHRPAPPAAQGTQTAVHNPSRTPKPTASSRQAVSTSQVPPNNKGCESTPHSACAASPSPSCMSTQTDNSSSWAHAAATAWAACNHAVGLKDTSARLKKPAAQQQHCTAPSPVLHQNPRPSLGTQDPVRASAHNQAQACQRSSPHQKNPKTGQQSLPPLC